MPYGIYPGCPEGLSIGYIQIVQQKKLCNLHGSNPVRDEDIGTPNILRECTGSCNSLLPRDAKVSAIDVTAKAIFERLYLIPGLQKCAFLVTIPYAPAPPPLTLQLFLEFLPFGQKICPPFFLSAQSDK